ncbi:unnamed protein product [Bursaphelenchus xylophilus]|uniref:(pine wood nematode) hypothetical protein n=1 Tax=Bursaphelenchus xylophilus TaxID=6326 RepID=A0A1I7SEE9_BURXY|nr:unnamed protein product [Bursaphelenchus xylophilus]CAG9104022.1 unnamed protein product [Bursaphelenchus xylophilus]
MFDLHTLFFDNKFWLLFAAVCVAAVFILIGTCGLCFVRWLYLSSGERKKHAAQCVVNQETVLRSHQYALQVARESLTKFGVRNEAEIRDLAKSLGFVPAQRNKVYNLYWPFDQLF